MWPLLVFLLIMLAAAARWLRRIGPGRPGARYCRRVPARPPLRHRGRRKPDWVRREVLALAVFLPSCRRIADVFNRRHGAYETVGHTFVNERCRAQAIQIAERRRAMRRREPRAVAPGHMWALDLTFFATADGVQRAVLGIIDCGSRLALRLKVLPRKCAWTLLGHLCLAIARHGKPALVKTDNESMFTSRLWRTALRWAGIGHRRSALGCPWQNGRIERFFGTLKPLLRKLVLCDAQALQRAADEFSRFYNEVRTHRALHGLTPLEAWSGKSWPDVWRAAASGCWVHALGGLLVGYRIRC